MWKEMAQQKSGTLSLHGTRSLQWQPTPTVNCQPTWPIRTTCAIIPRAEMEAMTRPTQPPCTEPHPAPDAHPPDKPDKREAGLLPQHAAEAACTQGS